MAKAKSNFPLRFPRKIDMEKVRKAAKLRKWSMNTFIVEASVLAAEQAISQHADDNLTDDQYKSRILTQ